MVKEFGLQRGGGRSILISYITHEYIHDGNRKEVSLQEAERRWKKQFEHEVTECAG